MLSPKKQDILIALAISNFDAGQRDKALAVIKQAYDLEPANDSVRAVYTIFAMYMKRDDLVKDLLLPQYHTYLIPDDQIIEAYIKTGQLKKYVELDALFIEGQVKAGLLTRSDIENINTIHKAFQDKVEQYIKANPPK